MSDQRDQRDQPLKPNQARVVESGITVIRWSGPDGSVFETKIAVVMQAMEFPGGYNPLIEGPVVNFTLGTVQEHRRISGPTVVVEGSPTRSVPPGSSN